MGLKKSERTKLESEVISNDARLKLTRMIRKRCDSSDANVGLINRNHYINIARTVQGLPIYRLEPDDMGMYQSEEFGWHMAETELAMRRPSSAELIEILGDMLQEGMLDLGAVNDILGGENVSVRFEAKGFDDDISVRLLSETEIEEEEDAAEHPNIRLLTARMEAAFAEKDFAAVLHASASIFETLAKLVFDNPSVENETLGGMFGGYRKRSELPEPVLDYILETYQRRNREPLAGHGATKPPTVSAKDAAVLIEMTKMCVRIERRLAAPELDAKQVRAAPVSRPPAAKASCSPPASRAKPEPIKARKKAGKKTKVARVKGANSSNRSGAAR